MPTQTADPPSDRKEITEAVLAAIWNEQAPLRGPMWDCEGNAVAVVYRGRWTAGSGPDFEGAMLALGESGALVSGSVEMHLRCGDWWAHGHHTDPRYNSVALHVVLWPLGVRPVTRADGAAVPTLVLADYITMPTAQLLESVTPLIPNLGALSEEPCWQRTQDWPLQRLLAHIDEAGDARLLNKAAQMEAGLSEQDAQEVFYQGIMDALGYSANRDPMRSLAEALPVSQLLTLPLSRDETERAALLEALFLGAAGFLPSQMPVADTLDWLSSQYAEEAERLWTTYAPLMDMSLNRPVADGWITDRVRPANSPPRRLAAAARILARLLWAQGGMLAPFIETATSLKPIALSKRWTELLTVAADGYWAAHDGFGHALAVQGGKEGVALVGSSRAADIVVNVAMPLLLAVADREGNDTLRKKVLAAYAVFPRLDGNKITRAMTLEALGQRAGKSIKGARRQQGLIHLYRLYCQARRCYECPISGLRQPRQI
ncbi:MAG TPA: DUF2851 family protein [Chloroflexia bacterium]|jgi:hypothetical protein